MNAFLNPTIPRESGVFAVDLTSPIALGRGFDSLVNVLRGDSMDPTKRPTMDPEERPSRVGKDAHGQDVSYFILLAESAEQLRSTLGIQASASFGIPGIGAKANLELFESAEFSAYSLSVIVGVRVLNSLEQLSGYHLLEPAKQLLGENKESFLQTYGDCCISAITTGGELTAVLQIQSRSSDERSTVKSSLAGSFGVFSSSAEFSSNYEQVMKQSTLAFTVRKRGGIAAPPDADLLSVRKAALAFSEEVFLNPINVSITTTDYNVASNLPVSPRPLSLSGAKAAMDALGTQLSQVLSARSLIDYVRTHPGNFAGIKTEDLRAKKSLATDIVSELKAKARSLAENPLSPCDPLPASRIDVVKLTGVEMLTYAAGEVSQFGNWNHPVGDTEMATGALALTNVTLTSKISHDDDRISLTVYFHLREEHTNNTTFAGTVTRTFQRVEGERIIRVDGKNIDFNEFIPGQLRRVEIPARESFWTDAYVIADSDDSNDSAYVGFSGHVRIPYWVSFEVG